MENPADLVTRAVSYKQLLKSNFHTGPAFLHSDCITEPETDFFFTVPSWGYEGHALPPSLIVHPVTSAALGEGGGVSVEGKPRLGNLIKFS